ncbi:MAG: hypothetical protein DRG69_08845 [Deltaproteobacteria bacterium]|nr:MAG: hypothetical protein DRG69_08845 [Deltaproteobacteria bacterium]
MAGNRLNHIFKIDRVTVAEKDGELNLKLQASFNITNQDDYYFVQQLITFQKDLVTLDFSPFQEPLPLEFGEHEPQRTHNI